MCGVVRINLVVGQIVTTVVFYDLSILCIIRARIIVVYRMNKIKFIEWHTQYRCTIYAVVIEDEITILFHFVQVSWKTIDRFHDHRSEIRTVTPPR